MDIVVNKSIRDLDNKLFSNSISGTEYNIVLGTPVTHNFTVPVYSVSITNKDKYCKVKFKINDDSNHIDIEPNETISFRGVIKKIILETYFSPCSVLLMSNIEIEGKISNKKGLSIRTSNYTLLAAKRNIVFGNLGNALCKSIDGGKTWVTVHSLANGKYFTNVHISTVAVVAFDIDGNIYYSANGGDSFTLSNTSALGTIRPPFYHGIDSDNSIIVFGEYATTDGDFRVFRSNNSGQTWEVVLTKSAPSEIRHFHSVNYNRHNGKWYLTSGDLDSQIRWWVSDTGRSWSEIAGVNNQRYRTLNLFPISYDEIMWGSDAVGTIAEICIAKLNDIAGTTRKIYNLPHACFGLYGNYERLIAITSVESYDKDDTYCGIYVSYDCGENWEVKLKCKLNEAKTQGGFRSIVGINDGEEFLIGIKDLKDINSNSVGMFIKID